MVHLVFLVFIRMLTSCYSEFLTAKEAKKSQNPLHMWVFDITWDIFFSLFLCFFPSSFTGPNKDILNLKYKPNLRKSCICLAPHNILKLYLTKYSSPGIIYEMNWKTKFLITFGILGGGHFQ